jgi:hypothetical protein
VRARTLATVVGACVTCLALARPHAPVAPAGSVVQVTTRLAPPGVRFRIPANGEILDIFPACECVKLRQDAGGSGWEGEVDCSLVSAAITPGVVVRRVDGQREFVRFNCPSGTAGFGARNALVRESSDFPPR